MHAMTILERSDIGPVRDLALRAGDLLAQHHGRTGRVDRKGRVELVTDLDRRSEALLVAELGRLFPGDSIVAEEGGAAAGDSGRTWFVDPLDGTTNYVHGHSHYCVSMACADAAGPLLAVVFAPYLDELYAAVRGGGAVLERPRHGWRQDLPRRGPVDLESALLATGFPYVRDDGRVERNCELVRRFLRAGCHGVRRAGSAALDLAHVGAGRLDGYWEMGLQPWDAAAGLLVAREAGALVTDFTGAAVPLPHDHVLAAVDGLHAALLAVIREVP